MAAAGIKDWEEVHLIFRSVDAVHAYTYLKVNLVQAPAGMVQLAERTVTARLL